MNIRNGFFIGLRTRKLLLPGTLWLSVLLLLASCGHPDAPEYYGFQDVKVGKVENQQANLTATLKFYNPNYFNLTLKSAEVDVALNGKPAGHSELDSTILIPKRDTFYVPVSMRVDLRALMGNAMQVLLERQVNIALDGKVHLKRGMFPINRPFHYEGKQDLKDFLPSGF